MFNNTHTHNSLDFMSRKHTHVSERKEFEENNEWRKRKLNE